MAKKYDVYNRELSWLQFNRRVLEEAANPDNPLLEKGKFLSICSSNLDEFFMVRVGALYRDLSAGGKSTDPAGMTPRQQLAAVPAPGRQQDRRRRQRRHERGSRYGGSGGKQAQAPAGKG